MTAIDNKKPRNEDQEFNGSDEGNPFHTEIEVYIAEHVIRDICQHALDTGRKDGSEYEIMGLMIGDVFVWKGMHYSIVRDIVTGERDITPMTAAFSAEDFAELFRQLEGIDYEYLLIGWYHTHPGFSCKPSGLDIKTQKRMFNQPYQCALILDTIGRLFRVHTVAEAGCREMTVGIFGEWNDPRP